MDVFYYNYEIFAEIELTGTDFDYYSWSATSSYLNERSLLMATGMSLLPSWTEECFRISSP